MTQRGLRAEPSYHSRLNLPLLVWVILWRCQHWGKCRMLLALTSENGFMTTQLASQSMSVFLTLAVAF